MSGAGPAGEITWADVRSRLDRVTALLVGASTEHDETAARATATKTNGVTEDATTE